MFADLVGVREVSGMGDSPTKGIRSAVSELMSREGELVVFRATAEETWYTNGIRYRREVNCN